MREQFVHVPLDAIIAVHLNWMLSLLCKLDAVVAVHSTFAVHPTFALFAAMLSLQLFLIVTQVRILSCTTLVAC